MAVAFLPVVKWIGAGVAVLLIVLVGLGLWLCGYAKQDAQQAQAISDQIRAQADMPVQKFEGGMIRDLPPIAQRYFRHAIADGADLHQTAYLAMEGEFIQAGTQMPMRAVQVLSYPHGFVWRARMGEGAMQVSGSDAFCAACALAPDTPPGVISWTRFRLAGLLSVARVGQGADTDLSDHARSAAARLLIEAIWTPASLLPQTGVRWEALGPNTARVQFPPVPGVGEMPPIDLVLNSEGGVVQAQMQRWSDANPERVFQFQPFGARVLGEMRQDGMTIPAQLEVSNHFDTPQEAVFFRATLTELHFGAASEPNWYREF